MLPDQRAGPVGELAEGCWAPGEPGQQSLSGTLDTRAPVLTRACVSLGVSHHA